MHLSLQASNLGQRCWPTPVVLRHTHVNVRRHCEELCAGHCGTGGLPDRRRVVRLVPSPSLVQVAVFMFRRTPLAVPTLSKEWWVTVAKTAAIDCCSCLSHERNHRSRRRRALPVPPSAPCAAIIDGLPRGFGSKNLPGKSNTCEPNAWLVWLALLSVLSLSSSMLLLLLLFFWTRALTMFMSTCCEVMHTQ